jgi:hypothetical protein
MRASFHCEFEELFSITASFHCEWGRIIFKKSACFWLRIYKNSSVHLLYMTFEFDWSMAGAAPAYTNLDMYRIRLPNSGNFRE